MKNVTRILLILGFGTLVLLSAACPERRSIADINANPGRYTNKDVTIVGVVKDSYGVSLPGSPVRGGIYKVDDGTGSIWVVTDSSVPTKGAEIGVTGTVGNGVSWGGRNYGLGVLEKDRRFRKR